MAGSSQDVVSMVDVLEEDRALEEEANAVLGASDDQNCTYPQGYIERQALYSCLTCCPAEESFAGVCFACSLHCHDGHDLVELYTKRNFRCDCGNSKFRDFNCKLFTEKSPENDSNVYNQNFRGKYCTCKRPYPDPDDEIEDEMIQCISCEDWFHSRHLGTLAPADYMEMICDACMQRLDFLRWYKSVSVSSQERSPGKKVVKQTDDLKQTGSNACVDVSPNFNGKEGDIETKEKSDRVLEGENQQENSVMLPKEGTSTREAKCAATPNLQTASSKKDQNPDTQISSCKLQALKSGNEDIDTKTLLKALFWPNHWRNLLCKCTECKDLYGLKGVPFILNEGDTVSAYEEKGKKRHENNTAYDKGMQAFSTMDRINQVEVLTEYNDMKSQLHEFFKSFAGQGKVVTKEDIEEFFAGMRAKKRRRLNDGTTLQYHCR